ncbi:MAG: bifunctional DNA-formamidopyrimidine glycosylase/DNA-(apurinic or apyrimidinic site) lyase [Mariprofundaceae bacterium]|nr:bifunctional DNA-formamidopyrimidine glycosylase/DNA-(apurinic or apyrimidinic site) lyase [Mariprofundaceae bacterium]
MPELPEVETVVNGLKPLLVGKRIVGVGSSGKNLRYPLPDFALLGQSKLLDVQRRAKYLLFHFENGQSLLWHLGMTGQFHVLGKDEAAAKHEHVRLSFADDLTLRYRDVRRFGYADICATDALGEHVWLKKLGFEPLSTAFDGFHLQKMLKTRKTSIKQAIMDNHVVVGVGNIYAAESLFRAKVHPAQQAKSLTAKQYQSLVKHIKQVLRQAIEAGGSTISDFVKADGKPGYFSHSFKVYGRVGEPCYTCKAKIEKIVQGGRASFFCPHCQP